MLLGQKITDCLCCNWWPRRR